MSKKNLIAFIITTTLVVLLFAAYFTGVFRKSSNTDSVPSVETSRQYIGDYVEYNGYLYTYNINLKNYLFLGIDTRDTLNRFTEPAFAGQSDAMFLLTVDSVTGESRILQINRNTMVDIDVYNSDEQIVKTMPGQITLQYAYATGGSHSVWAAKRSVSNLLYNIPIDAYFVMNLEGINAINDAVGGVDIVMPRDYTVINRSMTSGANVHISGDMAESFVRYRDINEFNSVADRMDRQVLYITALLDELSSRGENSMYNILEPFIGDVIITNMDQNEFRILAQYSYSGCHVDFLPGETVMGEMFEEFNVDRGALQDYIIRNFYVLCE